MTRLCVGLGQRPAPSCRGGDKEARSIESCVRGL